MFCSGVASTYARPTPSPSHSVHLIPSPFPLIQPSIQPPPPAPTPAGLPHLPSAGGWSAPTPPPLLVLIPRRPCLPRHQLSHRARNPSCPCWPPSMMNQLGLAHLFLSPTSIVPGLAGPATRRCGMAPALVKARRTLTGSFRCAAGAATGRPARWSPTTPLPPHSMLSPLTSRPPFLSCWLFLVR
jgi:hypothetical protein